MKTQEQAAGRDQLKWVFMGLKARKLVKQQNKRNNKLEL